MSNVVSLGKQVQELLTGQMIILFSESVPEELAMYCVLHNSTQRLDPSAGYHYLQIGNQKYKICEIGSEAYLTWNELGHVTIRLQSETERLPGSIYLESDELVLPVIGDVIKFVR